MALRAVRGRHASPLGLVLGSALTAALWVCDAGASSMRCQGGVVRVGDTESTVLAACGEPHHREEVQRELRAAHGRGLRVIDVKTWSYKRGIGRFILHLTFEGGLMTRIDRGPRQETP